MALTSSNKLGPGLSSAERETLLTLATASIEKGLIGERLRIDSSEYSLQLREPGASFVTIKVALELRGCIGSLDRKRVLAEDVVCNAYSAAFSDPRFSPLTATEFNQLNVHISVLGRPEPIVFTSEGDLVRQLRPGIDGVILEQGTYRATYLPSVWESLPDPHEFLCQLKGKAGLASDSWSDEIKVQRYTIESIP
ncbi:MAG: AmmeMemoRadiSam system protein A [Acidiferrobacterales bacterium]